MANFMTDSISETAAMIKLYEGSRETQVAHTDCAGITVRLLLSVIVRIHVGAAARCDLLIFTSKIKRSQPRFTDSSYRGSEASISGI
jgi:hypothetical protein